MDPDVQFYFSHAVILSFILTKFNSGSSSETNAVRQPQCFVFHPQLQLHSTAAKGMGKFCALLQLPSLHHISLPCNRAATARLWGSHSITFSPHTAFFFYLL